MSNPRSAAFVLRRQWRLVRRLAGRPRTIKELADEFRVSKNTIQRDLDIISDVFPVVEAGDPLHRQRILYQLNPNEDL